MIRNALTLLLVSTLWVLSGCEQQGTPSGQAEGLPQNESPSASPGLGDEPRSPGAATPGGQADQPAIDRPSPTPPPAPRPADPPPPDPGN